MEHKARYLFLCKICVGKALSVHVKGGICMKGFFSMFKESAKEMTTVRGICVMGMLIALHFVLSSIAIPVGATIEITFSFLAVAAVGMLMGPTAGAFAGLATNLIQFMFANKVGGAFHFGFTFVEIVAGLIFGIFLYRAKISKPEFTKENFREALMLVLRFAACRLTAVVVCNLLLRTYFLSDLYGTSFMLLFPERFLKNAAQYPVDVALMCIVLPAVKLAYDRTFRHRTS